MENKKISDKIFFILLNISLLKSVESIPLSEFYGIIKSENYDKNNVRLNQNLRKIMIENNISKEIPWVGQMIKITINLNKLTKFLEDTPQFESFCLWRLKVNKFANI
ncbi:MAG: hypothetical protein AABY22_13670 [Nanoarchaeota archaeon]